MDFDLTEAQRMIRDMSRDFSREVIAPRAEEVDRTGNYDYDVMARMGDLGMMGIPFPAQYGGSDGDWVSMNLCIEEVSRGDAGLGICLDVTTLVAYELFSFGTEDQKQKWLVPITQGKDVGAFGLTEPDTGSDAASISTAAVEEGGEWVVNGTKQFITNIGLENCYTVVVAAVSGRDKNGKNIIDTFIIPKGTPGFTVGKEYNKMGMRSSSTNEIIFEDCRIPNDNAIGEKGRGLGQHLAALQTGRISIAAVSVGLAQACLDAAASYATERVQFGKRIADFQGVSFKLADMAVSIELGRLMYLKAAFLKDNGRPHAFEASAAKLYASEMAERVASSAIQIHGGYGYMDEYAVSRYYRQAKMLQIVEGTSEVQRILISRNLLG